jgi:hypothetical protein
VANSDNFLPITSTEGTRSLLLVTGIRLSGTRSRLMVTAICLFQMSRDTIAANSDSYSPITRRDTVAANGDSYSAAY